MTKRQKTTKTIIGGILIVIIAFASIIAISNVNAKKSKIKLEYKEVVGVQVTKYTNEYMQTGLIDEGESTNKLLDYLSSIDCEKVKGDKPTLNIDEKIDIILFLDSKETLTFQFNGNNDYLFINEVPYKINNKISMKKFIDSSEVQWHVLTRFEDLESEEYGN